MKSHCLVKHRSQVCLALLRRVAELRGGQLAVSGAGVRAVGADTRPGAAHRQRAGEVADSQAWTRDCY